MTRHKLSRAALFSPSALLLLSISVFPQMASTIQPPSVTPQMGLPAAAPQRVAGRTSMMCAGYIRHQKFSKTPEIVGAEQEQEQRTFVEGDLVYINAGSNQSLTEGQTFQIVRPRGDLKGVHSHKNGFLGTYVQEIGQLSLLKVRQETSLAQITYSCSTVLMGDLLTGVPEREAPIQRSTTFDKFADPSGKQTGRLMMAQDNREMVTERDVVYIDLGAEDQIKTGDYLTIYRPLGGGNITRIDNEENAKNRLDGFQSDRFRGGGYSNQATRAKDTNAFHKPDGRYRYRPITTKEMKRLRPLMPRKNVGEMVVIDVQARTATAIITRAVTEVFTGDWVEIQ
jgi:hypothetical protein